MAKIFQLITSINLGGAENIAFQLSEFCNQTEKGDKHDIFIIELFPSSSEYAIKKREELKAKDIKLITLVNASKRVALLFAPFRLFHFVNKEQPDIIHSHTDLPDFVLSNTLRLLSLLTRVKPKIVRTIQNTKLWDTHPKLGKFTESYIADSVVVGVSENALQAYKEMRLSFKQSICNDLRIIYNSSKTPKTDTLPFEIDPSKINIAFCARFEHQKGIDVLADRILSINQKYNSLFNFYLIGHGTYEGKLKKIFDSHTNVYIYKPILNIADKFHNFDFIIMPSRFEGLVITSVEASFAKVPVIAAYAPGLTETLPQDWPLFFKLDDEIELLDIFDSLVNNKYDLNKLKAHAFNYVKDKFSFDTMINNYSKIYSNLTVS
ncbi:glycosyltransferase family 4 protein [Spirosoma sp. SC4-14]|uniref:glycosyltransferase family 4 protein n=1 Tax=Spirosoma sp. SC4-14 TaxID=3128900 RepID=UPI0030D11522